MRAGALRNFPGQWAPAPPTGLSDAGHEARALRGHSPAGLLEPERDTGAVAGGAPGRRPPALAHRHSRRRAKAGVRPGLSGALGAKNVTGWIPQWASHTGLQLGARGQARPVVATLERTHGRGPATLAVACLTRPARGPTRSRNARGVSEHSPRQTPGSGSGLWGRWLTGVGFLRK